MRDGALIMLGTGMRPGEALSLRWENILLGAETGLIQITQGKSKAAKRVLPMVTAVRKAVETRWKSAGEPTEGSIFPSADSQAGHLVPIKDYHARALKAVNDEAKEKKLQPLKSFEPYILRHTALTRLGESSCNAFTLALIAALRSLSDMSIRKPTPSIEPLPAAILTTSEKRPFQNRARSRPQQLRA